MSPMSPRLLRPRATGFSPTQIAGLSAWWDASASSTVTTASGAVSEWRSRVGTATATQGTAANRPSYTGTQNGKNVITFDGSNDYFTTSTLTIAQPYTFIWAGRSNGLENGPVLDAPFVTDDGVAGGSNRVAFGWNWRGLLTENGRMYAWAGVWLPAPVGTQAYNIPAVAAVVFNGASSSIRANGEGLASGNAGSLSIGSLRLGDRYVPSTGTAFDGYWGDFLIYNRALSTAEIQTLEGWLAWKWGTQATLPYDHPYAASFPGYAPQTMPTDADALAYLSAVRTADGGTGVEVGVANAVDSFVKGCKADGIWSAIKASCILAGARTLSGALVPLAGTAPTNNNFVAADYNRKTGLIGNGSTKYLDSNRAGNTDPQNSFHLGLYASTVTSANKAYIGAGGGESGASSIFEATGTTIGSRSRSSTSASVSGHNVSGFIGHSRSSSTSYTMRGGGSSSTQTTTTDGRVGQNIVVFAVRTGDGTTLGHAAARLAFCSIGESLDLALLDSRVSALYTAIGAAI